MNDDAQTLSVNLLGGPPDRHDSTTAVPAADLDAPNPSMLLVSEHPPRHATDTGDVPRALYSPDPFPAPPDLWWFRGWSPAGAEWRRPSPDERRTVSVSVDGRGVPLGWIGEDDIPWKADHHRVHWHLVGKGRGGTDLGVWQVQAHSPDHAESWELVHDPGAGGWSAAPVPAD